MAQGYASVTSAEIRSTGRWLPYRRALLWDATDNSLRSLRAGNVLTAKARVAASRDAIGKLGVMMQMHISEAFHALRVEELELTADYLMKKHEEREAAIEERARLREERRVAAELAEERARLDKERNHLMNALGALREGGVTDPELERKLTEIDEAIAQNDYRTANIRAGYVYVVSPALPLGSRRPTSTDAETGGIRVDKLVLVHDIGRAINPTTIEGQLEGAMSLGIGYALFEDASIDPQTGALRGSNLNTYRLGSTLDMPETELLLYEEPAPSGSFGGKGVGMCGIHGVAAAVANAIYDAVGVRMTESPISAEWALAALKTKERRYR
jgi:hypothetical protein